METLIDRTFVRLSEGLVHLRRVTGAAHDRPLCLIHLSPLSSRSMEPMMRDLRAVGYGAPLLAPDTLGAGDSAPPEPERPDIAYYADSLARVLDQLGIDQVDLFGAHTGARIVCEFALAHPDRTGRLVMDGVMEYPAETRALFKERYAPPVKPDAFGSQFSWGFNYMRNQYLFFPWFLEDEAHSLTKSMPDPHELHAATLDLLKVLDTYHLAYAAAFEYPSNSKVAALTIPTLLLKPATGTPAINMAADRLANGRNILARSVDGNVGAARLMSDFLAAKDIGQ